MKKTIFRVVLGLVALTVAGYFAYSAYFAGTKALPPELDTPIVPLSADFLAPDAVLASSNLADLPRALMQVPFIKRVFTEDLVDYYENHSDRLGIEGALRRIAFEHELTIQDHLLVTLLSQPAEVALWKTDDGRLGHWIMRTRLSNLNEALLWLGKVASSDSQLVEDGQLQVAGKPVPLYKLTYSNNQSLWFASRDDRLVVLSHKTWLESEPLVGADTSKPLENQNRFGDVPAWQGLVGGLLDQKANPLLQHYGVQAAAKGQALVLGIRYLSFGYQDLFSNLQALRLDLNGDNWYSHLLAADNSKWDASDLWHQVPTHAALCLSAVIEWPRLANLFGAANLPEALLQNLEPVAGICWYGDSSLYAPLLVAKTSSASNFAQASESLFDWLVGAGEPGLGAGQKLPVKRSETDVGPLFTREVGSEFGDQLAEDEDLKNAIAPRTRHFTVALAQAGDVILFSPDKKLVEQALDVQRKKFPALSDNLADKKSAQAYINAKNFSLLLQKATTETMPGNESLIAGAITTYLMPHLVALGEFDASALVLSNTTHKHWNQIEWAPVK